MSMKKIFFILVALFHIINASGATFTVDGINYTLLSATDQTCSVASGDYKGHLVIPDEITYGGRVLKVVAVDDEAIRNLPELTGCIIGKNVETIGTGFLSVTPMLQELTIPSNVNRIGPFSFVNCGIRKLTVEYAEPSIKIGVSDYSTVVSVPSTGTFAKCPNLEEVYWNRYYMQISDPGARYSAFRSPFFGSNSIKRVTIGPDTHNWQARYECNNLMFRQCENIEEVTFEEGASYVANGEFLMCKSLKKINLPSSMRLIDNNAFEFCENLTEITLPEGIEILGQACFNNTALTELTLPESVNSIPSYLGASLLEKIVVNTSCDIERAFRSCKDIRHLVFGPNVTTVNAPTAFSSSNEIVDITMQTLTPPVATDEFTSDQYLNTKLLVPNVALDAYKEAPIWKNFWNIEGYAYSGIENMESDSVNIEVVYGGLLVNGLEFSDNLKIYSLEGTLVSIVMENGTVDLSPGLYVIVSGDYSQKIVVR